MSIETPNVIIDHLRYRVCERVVKSFVRGRLAAGCGAEDTRKAAVAMVIETAPPLDIGSLETAVAVAQRTAEMEIRRTKGGA